MKALVEISIHTSIIHGSQWVENQNVDLESLMSCVIEEEDELMFVQVQHAAEFCRVFGQVSPCPDPALRPENNRFRYVSPLRGCSLYFFEAFWTGKNIRG